MDENAEFLTGLDKKLHYMSKFKLSFSNGYGYVDSYTRENMTKEEIEKVLEISKKMNFIIYPINTSMGFSVGYDVCQILPTKKVLLRFKESQLPKEYTFDKMSKNFMSKANRAKAKIIKEEIVNDYSHYDY